jgi:hypothetical protein
LDDWFAENAVVTRQGQTIFAIAAADGTKMTA